MTLYPKISRAERVGHWLGKGYCSFLRQEWRLRLWLVAHGLPAWGAAVITWSMRLSVLVLLVSCSFLLTLLVAMLFLIGRGAAQSDLSYGARNKEWRHGDQGFGFYEHGVRTDYGRLFETDEDR